MMIGRQEERKVLQEAMQKEQSQLIAIYGRRRIGKTYLVREVFQNHFTFYHSGAHKQKKDMQLFLFYQSLLDAGLSPERPKPKNWFEAFLLLRTLVQSSTEKKKVIFIDELSWIDTPKSDLISALEYFWNAWASARKDVVMILCSSATSWILNKVIHNKGGLYNRLTGKIHLKPFSLAQCRDYCDARHLALSDNQILELYMVLGGVPYYWEQIKIGYSVPQNIDYLFFQEDAPLRDEYDHLFAAIFHNPAPYEKIIHALEGKKSGITRADLLEKTGLSGSGTVTRYLEELESCGFIREYHGFGKKSKESLFQLIDPFVLFYLHFVKKHANDSNYWTSQINTPAVNTWNGLAFEQVCLLHVDQIKKALGVQGVLTTVASFTCRADPEKGIHGSQIDLILQRADRIINILEMKYTQGTYTITKSQDEDLHIRLSDFLQTTRTREAVHLTIITPYGLTPNMYSGNIQSIITAEDLFRE